MSTTRTLFAGLIAGVAMGMIEMLFAAFSGEGFWTPLIFISATVLRDLQSLTPPAAFMPVAVVLGMMGHLVNSIVLGMVFGWLAAPRLRGSAALVVGGTVYGLIVFVAALNILISLIMMVMEKTKDVAVLISMGAKRRQIRGIFMFQGVLIGVIGTVAGLVLGYAVAIAGAKYHFVALSSEVYSIDYLPFAPRVIDGVLIAAVALFISFVATLYPSWSAARVLPAEALRYE